MCPGLPAPLRGSTLGSAALLGAIPALSEPATASRFLALTIIFSPSGVDQSTTAAARALLHGADATHLRLAGPSCERAGADPAGRGTGVSDARPTLRAALRPHRPARGRRTSPRSRPSHTQSGDFLSNKCTFLFLKQKYRFRLNNSRISLNEAFAYFPVLIGCIINSPDPALSFQ